MKNLPEERQEQIFELLRQQSIDAVRKALACGQIGGNGIKVARSTISEFRTWYARRLQFGEFAARSEHYMELLRKTTDLPQKKIDEYGNAHFQMQAMEQDDPDTFLKIQTARHKAQMDHLKHEQKEKQIVQRQEAIAIERDRLALDLQKHKDAMKRIESEVEKAKSKGGIEAGTLERIERELKLL